MPEGHSIRRDATQAKAALGGQVLRASSPQGRFAESAALLDGLVLRATDPHGKHLFLDFAPTPRSKPVRWLHVHRGLYGVWMLQRHDGVEPLPPRGAVRLRLSSETHTADLRGPTACDLVTPPEVQAIHDRLGADPLRPESDPERAWERIHRSRVGIGALLMQQEVVAGVGNVYRAEVLFRARVDPYRQGRDLTRAEWDGIWADLVELMRAGVRSGRIVTTLPQDRERTSGRARRVDAHYVYRRAGEPCRVCGTPVRTAVLVARNLFWCPVCQAH
ncbi:endonuclease VIII [Angustibacter aerolatus]|uniref:DNA-(apurinic or apyrimidinic site) lyase n=1 Tax=Angustibacter aerolatus TaxID=1162965 RepID=A0ABQ6JC68_9ACTN|nr:endonuclease VIII [Angustibacter aerolatus]